MSAIIDEHVADLEAASARMQELVTMHGPALKELEATLDGWEADPRAHRKTAKHLAALTSVARRAGRIQHDFSVAKVRCERAAGTLLRDLKSAESVATFDPKDGQV